MLNKKLLKFILKLAVSLFFVWWIIFKIDWLEVLFYFKKISIRGIIFYISAYFLGMFFSVYKWRFLASFKEINLPIREYFKAYFTGTFVNNFYKIYRIGKLSDKYKEAASSVVMDRLTGFLGGMFLVFIFSVLNWKIVLDNKILLALNLINIILLLSILVFIKFFTHKEISTPIKKVNEIFNRLMREVNRYNGESKTIWKAIGLSFFFNLTGLALANYILFWSLGISVGVLDYLSVIFLISIVSSLPVSINNIGIKEWAYITFFGFFGLNPAAVISVAILSRIIQMLLSFLAVGFYLRNKKA
ncbi:MAG: hypothetical protein UR60_C0021G0018 [Candidatus Moranbacteria bacterium GW2011_GWF2_34_56]|nr:MAG: hypothetical protein UR60_C0021G0018 [Candidatus Moranbacteria bacterium GW2011_GWF2_34_56]